MAGSVCRLRLRNDSSSGAMPPAEGIAPPPAPRPPSSAAFCSDAYAAPMRAKQKNGGRFMDVSQLSINTAVTLAEAYRYADTIFRASPPEAASRRQRKIRRWMCRYIRNMPELPRKTRRKLLHCEQAAFFAFLHQCMAVAENGRGTGRQHSEKRRVLLTFAYKARCGNSCGWSIGRMCKTRQASSESS